VIFMGMSSLPGPAGVVNGAIDRPMHALRAHRRGGPEQLVYEQAPRPPLGIGDVLVEVHAASFTPTELGWPSSWTDRLGRDRTPVIPGHEVSGVVAALGFGTSGLTVGEEVYGLTDWYRDAAGGALVAVVGGTAVGPPRQDARWVFFVVEADRDQLTELGRRVDTGSCGRSSVGCCRWPRAARRSGPSSTAACRARSCCGSPTIGEELHP
jgi:hypothetical protein